MFMSNVKKWVIFIAFITSIILAQAQTITLEYPSEVSVGEEFEIKVMLINFSDGAYDLKFDIKNGNKNLAQVYWEDDWKSTHYWMKEAFINQQEKKFQLKVTESYSGVVPLIVKIREGNTVELFEGDVLMIIDDGKNEDENKEEENIGEKDNKITLDWNKEEIINGVEFEIKINGVKDKDVRLWIEKNNEIITERYDENNEEWKSGLFYINNFNEEIILLRIKNKFSDFDGEATIKVKIRDNNEQSENIVILASEFLEKSNENKSIVVAKENDSEYTISSMEGDKEIIQLGTGKVVEQIDERYGVRDSIIYESKTEKIKIYALFGFVLLCVVIGIFVVWRKLEL